MSLPKKLIENAFSKRCGFSRIRAHGLFAEFRYFLYAGKRASVGETLSNKLISLSKIAPEIRTIPVMLLTGADS